MGTPPFAVPALEALAAQHQVAAVYTRPDSLAGRGQQATPSAVKRAALALGLPVVQPRSLKDPGEQARLREMAPELIAVAGYGLLLPPPVLDLPVHRCLNLHPSLLPRHRGPSPIPFAILRGDLVTGVTLMLMDEGLDTGPALLRVTQPISPQDTAQSLGEALARLGAGLLLEGLSRWVAGELAPRPQEGEATYSRVLKKEDGRLDWALPARELWLRVRAFHPWPGTFTLFRGRLLKVLEAESGEGSALRQAQDSAPPGVVVAEAGGAAVGTGQGLLRLRRVQIEGKRPLAIDEFLRGRPDFVGAVLG